MADATAEGGAGQPTAVGRAVPPRGQMIACVAVASEGWPHNGRPSSYFRVSIQVGSLIFGVSGVMSWLRDVMILRCVRVGGAVARGADRSGAAVA